MGTVTTTGFGDAAVGTLARILHHRRAGDPLAPALVVCTGPLVAVATRRALGQRPRGIAGITVISADRLIDELAAPALAKRGAHRASSIEIRAAIRAELNRRPGRFGPVAGHRTTAERLVRLHHQLAGLPAETIERMAAAGPSLTAEAFRVIRAAGAAAGPATTDGPLLELALGRLAATEPGSFGPIVVYLPEAVRPVEGRLMEALVARPDCEVVVGLTGEPTVDRRHRARLSRWGVEASAGSGVELAPASLIEVADPGDEVRVALGELTARAALGESLDTMAILYTTADPYLSLIHEQLAAADLPWCGPGRRPLIGSVAGRFVARSLALAENGLERSAVINWLSGAPILLDGPGDRSRVVPAAQWDQLSRQAGVIDDEQWEPRVGELARHLDGDGAAQAGRMIPFMTELRARLRPESGPVGWQEWLGWSRDLIERYLGPTDDWPAPERLAAEAVGVMLDQLAVLDRYQGQPDRAEVAATVVAELEGRHWPGRPIGRGLLVAPVDAVTGMAFDRVVVVGLVEGRYPRTPREDSLLPAAVRAESGGALPPAETATDTDTRAVAAAVAATRLAATVVVARGDLRSSRSRSWPRILDGVVGERVVIDSHHRVLRDHGRPPSAGDLDLRSLILTVDQGGPVTSHPLATDDEVLAAGLDRSRHRSSATMDRHVGLVPANAIDPTERLLSATALEDYAACPRRYLFARVLRLAEEIRPERIEEITPLDRGSLVHLVLERFMAEMLAAGTVPRPRQCWRADQRGRILAILDEEVERARTSGLTGGRVNTAILSRRLRSEMIHFLDRDDELRASRGSTPLHVEYGFGMDDEPSDVALPDGRVVRLRGRVDRVDATEDGGVLVIDYKGGSGSAFSGLTTDPLDGGRRLQLPLYARVVADKLGRDGPRTALYWLTRVDDVKPVELVDRLDAEVDVLVGAALDGIAAGLFPGVPGEAIGWPRLTFDNCRYCAFDRICPTDRQREWETIRSSPHLDPVAVLLRPGDRTAEEA
jgi:hypothetical protein